MVSLHWPLLRFFLVHPLWRRQTLHQYYSEYLNLIDLGSPFIILIAMNLVQSTLCQRSEIRIQWMPLCWLPIINISCLDLHDMIGMRVNASPFTNGCQLGWYYDFSDALLGSLDNTVRRITLRLSMIGTCRKQNGIIGWMDLALWMKCCIISGKTELLFWPTLSKTRLQRSMPFLIQTTEIAMQMRGDLTWSSTIVTPSCARQHHPSLLPTSYMVKL